jgi:hypothetical protein
MRKYYRNMRSLGKFKKTKKAPDFLLSNWVRLKR